MSRDAELVKKSLVLLEDVGDRVAAHFYALLFLRQPGLREMFPPMMDAQRGRLFRALIRIAADIEQPRSVDDYLTQLGQDHRKYGVRPEHYALVGECLVATLRRFAGEDWDAETERAWQAAFELIAGRMIAGSERLAASQPPWWHAQVVAHERRRSDIAVLTVRTETHLPYHAGQHVSIETARWPRVWRPYSVANAPHPDRLLTFHVRALDAGWVSGALVRHTGVGDLLRLGPPRGTLVADRDSTRDVVCVAGGTGLAPLKALVEDMGRWNRTRSVHLFFGARTAEDLYDLPALRDLAARYQWLRVVPAVSDDPGYDGERGALPDVVARLGSWTTHDAYLSGPPPMVRATVSRLQELGMPLSRLRHDKEEATIG